MEQTTLFSQIVLALSVPIAIGLVFVTTPQRAVILAVLGSELFMPEVVNFKFPFMPAWDKHTLPYVCVLIGCLLKRPRLVTRVPKERWILVLTILLVGGGIATGLANSQAMERSLLTPLPGLNLKDSLALSATDFVNAAMPFYVGYVLFRRGADLRLLLAGFSVGAVIYIPFELWEIRMSPQLHRIVYGFFQDAFDETVRWGGYRPLVFMKHGLALARFSVIAAMAPFVFGARPRAVFGVPWSAMRWFLLVVLVLCKSTGAVLYLILSLPLLLWSRPRRELAVATLLSAIVVLYPVLRMSALIPTEQILQLSHSIVGPERTQSVQFRFENEDKLLAHARERPVFGWGSYGRNFVFDRYGKPAVSDGYWIIQFGGLGMVGFMGSFGFLLLPIYLARRRLPRIGDPDDRRLIAGTSMILAIVAVDLLPNGMWGLYPFLLSGALAGVTREWLLSPQPPNVAVGGMPYARMS